MRKKPHILSLSIVFCLSLRAPAVFAQPAEQLKIYILEGDYTSAIKEGEHLLASTNTALGRDEIHYLLGISYLKHNDFARALEHFERVVHDFSGSRYADESFIAAGDAYLLKGESRRAGEHYKSFLKNNPRSKFKPLILHRLSSIERGNNALSDKYSVDEITSEFPLLPELRSKTDYCSIPSVPENEYYAVQVGAFSKESNAKRLTDNLLRQGYQAYIISSKNGGQVSYRVRVGRAARRQEAEELQLKLAQEGYPTRICP